MSKKKCAYCGKDGKMTKEHVFPNFINDLIKTKMLSFINGVDKAFIDDPEIKDVCSNCNNIILSNLDSYAKNLSEKYFIQHINTKLIFEYSFNSLLRWILKVIYNGCRAFKSSYSMLKPYVPFILDENKLYPNTLLYICTMKSSYYKKQFIEPKTIGISEIFIRDKEKKFNNIILAKAFYFYSYFFILIGFNKNPEEKHIIDIDNFVKDNFGAIQIKPELNNIEIDPLVSKLDYMTHMYIQNLYNPKKIDSSYISKIPELREFTFYDYNDKIDSTQNYILTFHDFNIPVLAFEEDKIHPNLLINNFELENFKLVEEFKNAGIKIERQYLQTYIYIIDYLELDNPYLSPISGIYQSIENWNNWKNAINRNDNFVLIGTVGNNINYEKTKLVSKIKVLEITEA